jgi:large subunit ribosomal protein L30
MTNTLKVTLVKSPIGRLVSHKSTLKGLGFKKMNQTKIILDTPENRGMINKISYLLKVEV